MPATAVPTGTVSDALHWRYATKRFDASRRIPDANWAVLEQALVLSPSTYGLQPWKFVVVTDPATREKLSAAAHGQRQPLDCSHFVVFAVRKNYSLEDLDRYLTRAAHVRGVSKESLRNYADHIAGSLENARRGGFLDAWMSRQVYIALGVFMASAAVMGVDVCPMEGIEPPKFDEILGLKDLGYTALCAGAAGYRSAEDKYASAPKVRFSPEDVILHV